MSVKPKIVLYQETVPYNKFRGIIGVDIFDWIGELVDWDLKVIKQSETAFYSSFQVWRLGTAKVHICKTNYLDLKAKQLY